MSVRERDTMHACSLVQMMYDYSWSKLRFPSVPAVRACTCWCRNITGIGENKLCNFTMVSSQGGDPQTRCTMIMSSFMDYGYQEIFSSEMGHGNGTRCVQETSPHASSELVTGVDRRLIEQLRLLDFRTPAASILNRCTNSKRQLNTSECMNLWMEESQCCRCQKKLVTRLHSEEYYCCKPTQESRLKLPSVLVTGSGSLTKPYDHAHTLRPVQETNYHASTKLVLGTFELSSVQCSVEHTKHTCTTATKTALQTHCKDSGDTLPAGGQWWWEHALDWTWPDTQAKYQQDR